MNNADITRVIITQAMKDKWQSYCRIPESCPVCGDDIDIHEWYGYDEIGPVNCDRNEN
jgi:hypothetical protein